MFFQQILNGLTLGSIYALVALGYTIIYGVLLLINFAQGEVFMIGAMVGLTSSSIAMRTLLHQNIGGPAVLLIAFIGASIVCGLLAVLIERLCVRPLRDAPKIYVLITTLGISIVLQNIVMLTAGSSNVQFPETIFSRQISLLNARISLGQLVIIGVCALLMFALHSLISYTKLGTSMRATRDDKKMARLVGIPTDRIIMKSFALAAVMAAVAGPLYAMNYGVAKFDMGYLIGIKAFTAAIFGGIGNIYGAMLGGLLIGLVESLTAGYVPKGEDYKDVFVFVALILILLIRPKGLLGERVAQAR